ncbi:S1C family serine protease [Azospirillum brasilense]|uniref:S1C family serine protease n=1 Tax=Azospirillum brasilense TaxID=192 RepID=UPI000E6A91AE|nr:S1C family serine protease [Azospirillum brasilense]NUB24588.1 PDZ domain-containing protein [Azospirillum brasilense]NUB31534.1 PDZ domain-containing protein [Azospirillum brasilense]RIW02715.1 serine protease [Azospirillum brasilense]
MTGRWRRIPWTIAFPVSVLAAVFAALLPVTMARADQLDAAKLAGALVRISATILPDSQSARSLGTEREGTGVVIDGSGLILTIGYTILEASQLQVTTGEGRGYPAEFVAYDQASGFGLLRAGMGFSAAPVRLGDSDAIKEGERAMVLTRQGSTGVQPVLIAAKREFAGYWEYLLDEAIFTTPPIMGFNGAALIDRKGELIGIGSLIVRDAVPAHGGIPGNMFVPVSALKPILADLLAFGRRQEPARPWLGVTLREEQGRLMVERVTPQSPAATVGIQPGDMIVGVAGQRPKGLADFYRKVWDLGPAGVTVPLELLRGPKLEPVAVPSADRYSTLKLNPSF